MSAREVYRFLRLEHNEYCAQCKKFIPENIQSYTRKYCSKLCQGRASRKRELSKLEVKN